jgi:selenocysteine-specific elongation factor
VPLQANELSPGDAGAAQLVLDRELALCAGDRFILRDVSAQRTLGGGFVLDPHPPARKRRTPERLRQLACLAFEPPTRALEALLGQPPFFVDVAVFARDHGLSARQREEAIEELGVVALAAGDEIIVMRPAHLQKLEEDALGAIDAHHLREPDQAGLGVERLRTSLVPRLPLLAFRRVLSRLAERGRISTEGAWVRRPSHEIRLTEADAARWTKIEPLLCGEWRFRPPRTRDIAQQLGLDEAEVRRLLKAQSRRGALDEIAHDHFFLRATTNEIVEILAQVSKAAPGGEITAALLRDQLNNGRKVAIQILDFFDRHGVTHRHGDLRRLNKARLDLFKAAL